MGFEFKRIGELKLKIKKKLRPQLFWDRRYTIFRI